jgi:ribonuclease HII
MPLANDSGRLQIDASRLRRAFQESGIACTALRCEALGAADFNRRVDETRNKSSVNMHLVVQQIEAIWSRFPTDQPRVVIDRQGGREAYRHDLQIAWPDASIRIVTESARLSRYALSLPGRGTLNLIFTAEAESTHLPVALASMVAKYTRELLMGRMNRYFLARQPGLRATAGYVEDARRYLQDIEPLLDEARIERGDLVRCC